MCYSAKATSTTLTGNAAPWSMMGVGMKGALVVGNVPGTPRDAFYVS